MRRLLLTALAIGSVTATAACSSGTQSGEPVVVTEIVTATAGEQQPLQDSGPAAPPEPAAPAAADPSDYAAEAGYFFSSASGKWKCGIRRADAGCHGPLPAGAPLSYGQRPTGAVVGSGAAELVKFSSPEFMLQSGRTAPVLPYGQTLTINGFSCSIDQTAGVTCRNDGTGRGFTVSDIAYDLF
ncbi:hypothetical protein GOHSU_06_00410 [Gordonia hirsuta DSM 44140 = NBRC 16056]|uniref:Lipoprotein n=1 Tax=Gordonia hirsuta DSM 44140 = NBRC 16056 TaxID=1121927 RepID=L7L658_9ACTN|nr:hypothetical protein GOHSU_06_00410 [Gordonia hirsuta DSM 44140 = NBRC 16056]